MRYALEEGDFAVLAGVSDEGEEVVLTGALAHVHAGESVDVSGDWRRHPRHGPQFAVEQRPGAGADGRGGGAGLPELDQARGHPRRRVARRPPRRRGRARRRRPRPAPRAARGSRDRRAEDRPGGALVGGAGRAAGGAAVPRGPRRPGRRGGAHLPRARPRLDRDAADRPVRDHRGRGDRLRHGRRAGPRPRDAARRAVAHRRRAAPRAPPGRGRRPLPPPARGGPRPRMAAARDRRRGPPRRADRLREARRGGRARLGPGDVRDRAATGAQRPRAGRVAAGASPPQGRQLRAAGERRVRPDRRPVGGGDERARAPAVDPHRAAGDGQDADDARARRPAARPEAHRAAVRADRQGGAAARRAHGRRGEHDPPAARVRAGRGLLARAGGPDPRASTC